MRPTPILRRLALALGCAMTTFACNWVVDVAGFRVEEPAVDASTDASADAGPECTRRADCAHLGDDGYCNTQKGQCVHLKSPDCQRLEGQWSHPHAIMIGSVLPTDGADRNTGLPAENAIAMAMREFHQHNGLPPATGSAERRHLALIGCNDNGDTDTARRAARHLVDDLGLSAIIGASFSGITIGIATDVTIPGGALLISPSATSVAITPLLDNGLVWRTAPSDIWQSGTLVKLTPLVEAQIKSRPVSPPTTLKVAVVHKGDAYGSGLAAALADELVFNGQPALAQPASFTQVDYGNPDSGASPDYAAKAAQAVAFAPDVIFLFGTAESINEMMSRIETAWPGGSPRPTYLLADGGLIPETWQLVAANDDLRKRIMGTVPGANGKHANEFKVRYNAVFNDGTDPTVFGAAGAYDAAYLIAYSAAILGDKPLTGANLTAGFSRLVPPGEHLHVGFATISEALTRLERGENIDYDGASGPLDFDLATGEAASDIQVWCLPKDMSGNALAGIPSGIYLQAKDQTLVGTLVDAQAACNL